jgi:hypothetical protein
MNDPIVEEVRRVREAYAARFNYNLREMVRDLQEKQKRSGRKYVSYPPIRIEPKPALPAATAIPPAADAPRRNDGLLLSRGGWRRRRVTTQPHA